VAMKIPVAFEGIPASDRPRSQKSSTVTLLSLTNTQKSRYIYGYSSIVLVIPIIFPSSTICLTDIDQAISYSKDNGDHRSI